MESQKPACRHAIRGQDFLCFNRLVSCGIWAVVPQRGNDAGVAETAVRFRNEILNLIESSRCADAKNESRTKENGQVGPRDVEMDFSRLWASVAANWLHSASSFCRVDGCRFFLFSLRVVCDILRRSNGTGPLGENSGP